MTREQFSRSVNADEKWVENAARLLGRSLVYSQREAQWLGLVRILSNEIGLTLARSAKLATEALRQPPSARAVRLGASESRTAEIVLDLARYHSAHNAAVSAALALSGPRKRGRPPAATRHGRRSPSVVGERAVRETTWDILARAKKYGVDLDSLRTGRTDSPAMRLDRLEENAGSLKELRGATISATAKRKRPLVRR